MERRLMANYSKRLIFYWVNNMKNVVEAAKEKVKVRREEFDAVKVDRDGKKDKQDKLAKAVKKLTQAEFDALPKALQKELKEYR